ncbi:MULTISPECIES: PilZ domain-containing protein [unclassified Erythrobacter]|uniref:PilZ domain-containing protein n=1 Tax=Erythrobacteraceae TaxID=335929 RepID=UPI00076CF903|nr:MULTISPECIES: PilZ domain-containing protein [unclassified Erythrobacter]KWV96260.1 hypothetical protein ASS64_03375 [Erythrobacter sp. AP23]MBO6526318.1 PilZ domain-containing protein [Erythrobacter sp.]MBO6530571.1 PilZ domain-containing protein [Erythrobacter sp.]
MTDTTQHVSPLRRDYQRLTLGVPAILETIDARHRVEIVDISQGGAQLVLPRKDAFAQECLLIWLHYEAFGSVSWRKGAHIGLTFDEPLSHKTIFETRRNAEAIVRQDAERTQNEARNWAQGPLRF